MLPVAFFLGRVAERLQVTGRGRLDPLIRVASLENERLLVEIRALRMQPHGGDAFAADHHPCEWRRRPSGETLLHTGFTLLPAGILLTMKHHERCASCCIELHGWFGAILLDQTPRRSKQMGIGWCVVVSIRAHGKTDSTNGIEVRSIAECERQSSAGTEAERPFLDVACRMIA